MRICLARAIIILFVSMVGAAASTSTSFRWWNLEDGSLVDATGLAIGVFEATVLTYLSDEDSFDLPAAIGQARVWPEEVGGAAFYQARPNLAAGRLATGYMTESRPSGVAVGQYAWAVVLDYPFAEFTDLDSLPPGLAYGIAGPSPAIVDLDTVPPGMPQDFSGFSARTETVFNFRPTVVWSAPSLMVVGTPLSAVQLNAEADIEGAFIYDPPPGTLLSPGQHHLSVSFIPAVDGWHESAASLPLTVIEGTSMWLQVESGGGCATILEFGEADMAAGFERLNAPAPAGACAHLANASPGPHEPPLWRAFQHRADGQPTRWRLALADRPGGGTAGLSWNVAAAAATREIWLQALDGERPAGFPVDMKVTGELSGVAPGEQFEIVYGELQTHDIALRRGWNAVGTPLLTTENFAALKLAAGGAVQRRVWQWRDEFWEAVCEDGPFLPKSGYFVYSVAESAHFRVVGLPPSPRLPEAVAWQFTSPVEAPPSDGRSGVSLWRWDAERQGYRAASAMHLGQAYWLSGHAEDGE